MSVNESAEPEYPPGASETGNSLNSPAEKESCRRYLLGRMTVEEMEKTEIKVLETPSFSELMHLTEDDLFEEYLDARMGAEDREQFESYFLRSDDRQTRLSILTVLREKAKHPSSSAFRKILDSIADFLSTRP